MTKITMMKNVLALGVAGVLTMSAVSPSMALPLASEGAAVKQSAPGSATTEVRWRRGWGWGMGLGAFGLGLAAATYPYYGPGYGYGPYYGRPYGYYGYYGPGPYGNGNCWRRWGRVYCN
jgi:hypothetical protein